MSGIHAFLAELKTKNIRVACSDGKLRINAPKNALTPALREDFARYKTVLLHILAGQEHGNPAVSLRHRKFDAPPPLSFGQQRLWFLEELSLTPAYHRVAAYRLTGDLNMAVLFKSLDALIARHEVMRTTFPRLEQNPVQNILPPFPLQIPIIRRNGDDTEAWEAAIEHHIEQETRRPFDLAKQPGVRIHLLERSETEYALLVTIHHIIFDAWSSDVFSSELAALYDAFQKGLPDPLPPLEVQYADYAAWLRDTLTPRVEAGHLAYWHDMLADAPLLHLPVDKPRPAVLTFRGTEHIQDLSRGLADRLTELGRRNDATLFMTLYAAVHALLYRYTGAEDMVLGSVTHGRHDVQLEKLIGFFANTLAMRNDLSGNPSFQTLLHRVRDTTIASYAHQTLPFDRVVEKVNPHRDPSRSPLFPLIFVLQNAPQGEVELPGLKLQKIVVKTRNALFEICLSIDESPSGLRCWWEYNTDLFHGETIQRLQRHFARLLEAVLADPGKGILDLALLSPDELRETAAWGDNPKAAVCAALQVASDDLAEPHIRQLLAPWLDAETTPAERLVVRVLDARGQSLPVGCRGQLFLGGPAVQRHIQTEGTDQTQHLVTNPLTEFAAERLLRTGLTAKWTADGTLVVVGSAHRYPELGGYQHDLNLITAAAAALPQVAYAHAGLVTEPAGRLITLWIQPLSESLTEATVRAALERVIPANTLPQAIIWLERLPLTEAGRLDEAALPKPTPPQTHSAPSAPRNATEAVLADIWVEVLGLETIDIHQDLFTLAAPVLAASGPTVADAGSSTGDVTTRLTALWSQVLALPEIGRDDNFFALGGHSLLAARLVAKIHETFHIELSLSTLFTAPTVATQSALIAKKLGLAAPADQPATPLSGARAAADDIQGATVIPRRGNPDERMPLSFAQQRLWFLDQMEENPRLYTVNLILRLTGPVDATLLERAFRAVALRHEVLRTRFRADQGEPYQDIVPEVVFTLPQTDLHHLQGTARETAIFDTIRGDEENGFDLSEGPLWGARLIHLETDLHVLAVRLHHSIADGWSLDVLLRDLVAYYIAFSDARQPEPNPLPIQYADFALFQRKHLDGQNLEHLLIFWRNQLHGAPPFLELPTDFPRPKQPSHRALQVDFDLDADTTCRLRGLSRQAGVSLFTALLTVFKIMTAQLSGSRDILVGTPIANRNHGEVKDLIGFFVNMLVLRTDLDGNPDFTSLAQRVHLQNAERIDHGELPFERLVADLDPTRDLGRTPLFQVLFSLAHDPLGSAQLPGVAWEPVKHPALSTPFDMAFYMWEWKDGLQGSVKVAADLWRAETIERWIGYYQNLVRAVIAEPQRPVFSLPFLGTAESKALAGWNNTAAAFPRQTLVHETVASRAAKNPNAVACISEAGSLTYADLNRRANRLAHLLVREGARPGDLIGVSMLRSADLLIAWLAVLKAGAAYLPIDASHPAARIDHIMADSGIQLLLCDAANSPNLAARDGLKRIVPAEQTETLRAMPADAPNAACFPEQTAYVTYTSGSTGKPKGVMVNHRNVISMIADTSEMPFPAGRTLAWLVNPAFDVATLEVWGALAHGCRLVPFAYDHLLDVAAFAERLAAFSVNIVIAPTALFHQLFQEKPDVFAELDWVWFAGEKPNPKVFLNAPADLWPGSFINGYGPTEATTYVTRHVLSPTEDFTLEVPMGHAKDNTEIHLLNPEGMPVPIGVPGEVYIGGEGVAVGYLNRPDLTADRFLPDMFSGRPGARLYRTGDAAYRLPNGDIVFVDRMDRQVKIRGYRMELGEIESVLRQFPGVRSALVRTIHHGGERNLIAYTEGPEAPRSAALHEHMSRGLPEYMIPPFFVHLESFPLTPNGKVDTRALPGPERSGATVLDRGAAPEGRLEEVLAAVWADVLGLPFVPRDANFFKLGGHSLLAVAIVSRVRNALGATLAVRTLFEAPTIAELANHLQADQKGEDRSMPPVQPVARESHAPVTFAQQRLWFLDRLGDAGSAYNMPYPLLLKGPLDAAAMERAFQEVLLRHEAPRTRFIEEAGEPRQVVIPYSYTGLPLIDLSEWPAERQEAHIRELIAFETSEPFDLEQGPLFRVSLHKLAEDQHLLFLNLHHVIADGWSLRILIKEWLAFHDAEKEGQPISLEAPPFQYLDFAVRQREWLNGDVVQAMRTWWCNHLAGDLPVLSLPTDRGRKRDMDYTAGIVSLTLSETLTHQLKQVAQQGNATLFMALFAAYNLLLGRLSNNTDIIVGTPSSGRAKPGLESVVGFFINTLPIRTNLAGAPSFYDLVARVRSTILSAFDYEDYPFERLVEELRPERDPTRNPIFQVFFNMLNLPSLNTETTTLQIDTLPIEPIRSKFDLNLYAAERADRLVFELHYNQWLFDAASAQSMVDRFEHLLAQIAARPEAPVDAHALITEAERDCLPDPRAPLAPLTETFLHQRIDTRATNEPDAPALVFGNAVVTYRALQTQTNQLAQMLIEQGVQAGDAVGLELPRGPLLPTAMIAVWKAGAAFVILDPQMPAPRRTHQGKTAAIRLILASTDGPAETAESVSRLVLHDNPAALAKQLADYPAERPNLALTTAPPAYYAFTSGTTGEPRAVVTDHAPVARFLDWYGRTFKPQPGDRVSMLSGLGHDPLIRDITVALTFGAAVHIPTFEPAREADRLPTWLRDEKITITHLTPALGTLLTSLAGDTLFPHLRLAVFGGDRLTQRLVLSWRRTAPNADIVNAYGTTETPQIMGYYHLPANVAAPADDAADVPIGSGIDAVQLLIRDEQGRSTGIGQTGVIHIRTHALSRGYLGAPDDTAIRFFDADGVPCYCTGDLGFYDREGQVRFIGRGDDQLSLNGFRVDPREIEACALTLAEVAEAKLVPLKEVGDTVLPPLYLVPPAGVTIDPARVRDQLAAQLPSIMVPSRFAVLERFPLTANGKIDRTALPPAEPVGSDGDLATATETEIQVAELFRDVLGCARVGVQDSFFRLGGHSLSAVLLLRKLAHLFQVDLALSAFFRNPTVAGTAEAVVSQKLSGYDEEALDDILGSLGIDLESL